MSSEALVSLSPVDTLTFRLEKDLASKAILKVTNTSDSKVVFKVKTTLPTWYYVRPNQQVVDVGATEEVVIVLIDSECSRFLERAASNKAERLDKHRFLVQAKEISDEEYARVVAIAPAQRSEEFNQLWSTGSKDDKKNLKLRVEFLYPEIVGSTSPKSHVEPLRSASENIDTIRNRIAKESTSNIQVEHSAEIPPENMLSELKSLRNKYDGVVAYTVRLTAERDVMVQKLEGAEKEIANMRKKSNNSDGSTSGEISRADRLMEKQTNMKRFPLVVVLLAALSSFLFGKYFKF